MDRRKSLKLLAAGALATGAVVTGCKPGEQKEKEVQPEFALDRNADELKYEKELLAQGRFFSDHEIATITVLADIIIPRDDVSGSASEAKVPEFIDFIVRDMPSHQLPMRGGLRWLDMQCLKRYERSFKDCEYTQKIEMVEEIAYPIVEWEDDQGNKFKKGKVNPGMEPGVAFFSLMRNLTATGFYTSQIGVTDIGYVGNQANQWNGVPADVLEKYGVGYTEKEMKECVKFDI
jgi:hypothetical protein